VGQKIEISNSVTLGDVAVFDTDRSLSGQDGERYRSVDEAANGSTYPAGLAGRLFADVDGVKSVYVTSNLVTIERAGGWDDDSLERASSVISGFFAYY
jgi:hypothetical protein